MSAYPSKRGRITPVEGIVVEGTGPELAQQFTVNVLHPLCKAIDQGQGAPAVASFRSCLVVQLIIDLQQDFGAQAAAQVLDVALGVLQPSKRH